MTLTELQGKRVRVYYNLHRKCLSVQYQGKVVAHVKHISLCDVSFHVSQKGRQRVLDEGVKNVHAFVIGWVTTIETAWKKYRIISYNPRINRTFVNAATHEEIYAASLVHIDDKTIYALGA